MIEKEKEIPTEEARKDGKHQHIYMISYDTIQEGDYIYCEGLGYPQWKNEIFQVTRGLKIENDIPYIGIKNTVAVDVRDFCKIIATTDPSLNLPKISDKIIKGNYYERETN